MRPITPRDDEEPITPRVKQIINDPMTTQFVFEELAVKDQQISTKLNDQAFEIGQQSTLEERVFNDIDYFASLV